MRHILKKSYAPQTIPKVNSINVTEPVKRDHPIARIQRYCDYNRVKGGRKVYYRMHLHHQRACTMEMRMNRKIIESTLPFSRYTWTNNSFTNNTLAGNRAHQPIEKPRASTPSSVRIYIGEGYGETPFLKCRYY